MQVTYLIFSILCSLLFASIWLLLRIIGSFDGLVRKISKGWDATSGLNRKKINTLFFTKRFDTVIFFIILYLILTSLQKSTAYFGFLVISFTNEVKLLPYYSIYQNDIVQMLCTGLLLG